VKVSHVLWKRAGSVFFALSCAGCAFPTPADFNAQIESLVQTDMPMATARSALETAGYRCNAPYLKATRKLVHAQPAMADWWL